MKRLALVLGVFTLLAAAPAFADDYLPRVPRLRIRLAPSQLAEMAHNAQAGIPYDQLKIAQEYAYGRDGKRDPAAALAWEKRAAEQGYLDAELALAIDYYEGGDVAIDKVKAVEWLRRASDHGLSDAQVALGEVYFTGAGVAQDYTQAYVWYSLSGADDYIDKIWLASFVRAAAKHMTPAQIKAAKAQIKAWRPLPPETAEVLAEGVGAMNLGHPDEARQLLAPLASAGNAAAQLQLGLLYGSKAQFDRGADTARAWFEKSATLGNPVAQYWIGMLYLYGIDGPQDRAAGLDWLRKSADQGVADAQRHLAALTRAGEVVPKDDAAATAWYRRAADQAQPDAQYSLSMAYQDGKGIGADQVQGYVWLTLASRYTSNPAQAAQWTEAAQRLSRELKPAQLETAQAQITAWHPVFEMP